MDDIVVACHDEEYADLMQDLNRYFTVTSLDNIKQFLSIQVERDGRSFTS